MTRSVFNHRRLRRQLSTDSFNRANNPSNIGSTDGQGILDPLTWVKQLGNWSISSNVLTCPGPAVNEHIATVQLGTADVDVSFSSINASWAGNIILGIAFRYASNTSNLYAVQKAGGDIELWKNNAGTKTMIANTTGHGAAAAVALRVVCSGSSLNVFRNGALDITVTEGFNATATLHGAYCNDLSAVSPTSFTWENWLASDA